MSIELFTQSELQKLKCLLAKHAAVKQGHLEFLKVHNGVVWRGCDPNFTESRELFDELNKSKDEQRQVKQELKDISTMIRKIRVALSSRKEG